MVKTLDQYIADGEIDKAVECVYRGMINAFNIYCPGLDLTKENLAILATPLKNKFLGIVDPEPQPGEEYERTPEPGDDIQIHPARAQLTIVYTCDDDQVVLPDPIAEMVTVGQEYYYASPEIAGYAAEPEVVEGKMTTAGATVTVVYTAVTEEKPAKYGKVEIIPDDLKADSHEKSVVEGDGTAKTVATIKEDVLEFAKAGDKAHSKELSGWWAGIKISKAEEADNSGKIRVYRYDGTYEEYTVQKAFTEDFKVFGYITPERLESPNGSDGMLTYTIRADWNNDGVFEQEIALKIDPATMVLKMKAKDTEAVWPKKK